MKKILNSSCRSIRRVKKRTSLIIWSDTITIHQERKEFMRGERERERGWGKRKRDSRDLRFPDPQDARRKWEEEMRNQDEEEEEEEEARALNWSTAICYAAHQQASPHHKTHSKDQLEEKKRRRMASSSSSSFPSSASLCIKPSFNLYVASHHLHHITSPH